MSDESNLLDRLSPAQGGSGHSTLRFALLAGPLAPRVVANHGLPHNPLEWAIWISTIVVVGLVVCGLWVGRSRRVGPPPHLDDRPGTMAATAVPDAPPPGYVRWSGAGEDSGGDPARRPIDDVANGDAGGTAPEATGSGPPSGTIKQEPRRTSR